MHDPMTVAFYIKYPWWLYRPWPRRHRDSTDPRFEWESRMSESDRAGRSLSWERGYRETFITIWHVDPERDGSDDSCGFSYPKLTQSQRKRLHEAAWSEGRNPYFLRYADKHWLGTRSEAEAIYRGLVLFTADVLDIPLTFDEAARFAAREIHQPDCIDTADQLCFLPGYHTNFPEASDDSNRTRRQERLAGIMAGIAAQLLRSRRRWYRHPRWHLWHWKIQVHPLQTFKRWAFSRCAKCGRGFRWGETVISNSWQGTGPRWFRNEQNVHCLDCDFAKVSAKESA